MTNKEQIEKVLLDIRPDIRADGADFQIIDITDEGLVTLKVKGSKKNKPRTRETLVRLLDYVLRKNESITDYQKIIKIDWETPSEGTVTTFMNKIFKRRSK